MNSPASTTLRCVVYRSRAAVTFSPSALKMLELLCASRNHTRGISGRLHYVDGQFVHVLEGPAEMVGKLLGVIKEDPRHTGLTILLDRQVSGRAFTL